MEDAAVVERLHSAGACIAGSTRMAEFGLGLDGDTSALAVAECGCDAALMTDTLGEARVAAAETGLIGFKPTAGTVSRYGLIGLIPSMESLGIVARDVTTISRIMCAVSGPDSRDFSLGCDFPSFADPVVPRAIESVAVIPQSLAGIEPAELKAFEAALDALRKTGASIREAPVEGYEMIRAVHQAVGAVEASSSASKYDSVRYGHRAPKADDWNEMYLRSREESFGPVVKAFLFQGAYFQFKNYPAFENACRLRRRLIGALDDLLRGADVPALLTLAKTARTDQSARVSQVHDRFAMTLAANVAGLPAISIPGFARADEGDTGLQLIAGRLDDIALLGYAAGLLSTHTGIRDNGLRSGNRSRDSRAAQLRDQAIM